MRKITIIVLSLMLCFGSFAQNNSVNNDYHPLVQEGKVWSVSSLSKPCHQLWYDEYTSHLVFSGDTIIEGKSYKKMYASDKSNPIFPQDWWFYCFMREDVDRKIYSKYSVNSDDMFLYDFSLQIGDTVPRSSSIYISNITYETMLNGENRRTLWLSDDSKGEFWIEGIGSNRGVYSPLCVPTTNNYSSYMCALKCFFEKGESLIDSEEEFWNLGVYFPVPCKLVYTKVESYCDNNKVVNIFPSPANDYLYIDNTNIEISNISLISIQGQIVKKFKSNITQLDISDVPSGIYFIKINSSRENFIQKVLIMK